MHVDRDRTNQTHISRGSSRRAVFLRMLPPGLAVLFLTSGLFGWASVSTTGIFATHQFFSRIAYQRLSEHPVFRHIRFPSLEAIEKYSGVHVESLDPFVIGGEGPDNSRICRYSDHWYNPLNETGGASLAVQKHYDLLRMKLANRGLSFGRHEIDPDRKWPQAKDAAWMAHFAQDMTCPLHVLGMPREKADEDFPQGENITGPYRTFDPALWRSSLRAARNDPHGALAD